MNPMMMVPHKYKVKKIHHSVDPVAIPRNSNSVSMHRQQQQQQQLFCHSPSALNSSWTQSVQAFVESGHAEDYDSLSWCE
mmetsp:Transcript_7457/g.18677  ORF Transcript_7457/g.18677 Transcript_7457/m.18677 type:complete len:80 (+) Transcript_7457:173-412(+)|eukprot:CAMPEP_0172384318 /NCGR_PEP_ID=MMETSP1061-20121228/2109_1 /TAXON_ID=37318 /ORGANISM="Pseudo-nitzschia pungens, Strain cf. pungens" /LENGTH=79 /DNA_ID=CAMNT_0013112907 /DNA_START=162 /DNA_END=401 /DNA_ORIENTATION=-